MSTPALRRGALTLPAVLMQGLSHIAPAAGVVLSIQFIVEQAGALAPLCYGLAFLLSGRLSVAIAIHFLFNFAHLALFTYPLASH